MKRRWQLFWIVELALVMVLGYQIISNLATAIGVVGGSLALVLGVKGRFWRTLWLTLGASLIVVSVFMIPTTWVILFLALVGGLFAMSGKRGQRLPWLRKQYLAVHARKPEPKANTTHHHPWFGDETIGRQSFEWDDLNLTLVAGDTIIDLGNTLLPTGDSTIVIRKGVGKTRILVPVGVGVMVDHAALAGTLSINGQELSLRNQGVTHYSADYDKAARRIHILTNVFVGDLEVLSV